MTRSNGPLIGEHFKAWLEGQLAVNAGLSPEDNPYPIETPERAAWARGMKDTVDDMNTDLYPQRRNNIHD